MAHQIPLNRQLGAPEYERTQVGPVPWLPAAAIGLGMAGGLGAIMKGAYNTYQGGKADDKKYIESQAVKKLQLEKSNRSFPTSPTEDARASKFIDLSGTKQGMALGPQASPGFDNMQKTADANDTAENSRIGGLFTPGGLEFNAKSAELNADDRMKARAMIGIGGTQVPEGGGYNPSAYSQNSMTVTDNSHPMSEEERQATSSRY